MFSNDLILIDMKHICLINELDRASRYGIGTYIKQLSNCIKKMDNTFLHLININCDINELEIKHDKNYSEYSFPYTSNNISSSDYRNIWFVFNAHLKKENDDELIVHLNCMHQYHLAKCIRNSNPNSSIILTIHYFLWSLYLKGNLLHCNNILQGKIPDLYNISGLIDDDRKILNIVDNIICLSNYTKNILLKKYKISENKIRMIYNGLKDDYEILSSNEKLRLKKELGFSNNENIILFVGRLDEIKGVNILIDAFKLLLNKMPNSKLVIVGEGDYSSNLSKCEKYWHKIIFTGRLAKKDLYNIYKIADIGVMPSMHEQCSYVAIEMLMFNIPLIISTTTGLNEVLDIEQNKVEVVELNDSVEISCRDLSSKIQNCLIHNTIDYRAIYLEKYTSVIMYNNMKLVYDFIV